MKHSVLRAIAGFWIQKVKKPYTIVAGGLSVTAELLIAREELDRDRLL